MIFILISVSEIRGKEIKMIEIKDKKQEVLKSYER